MACLVLDGGIPSGAFIILDKKTTCYAGGNVRTLVSALTKKRRFDTVNETTNRIRNIKTGGH